MLAIDVGAAVGDREQLQPLGAVERGASVVCELVRRRRQLRRRCTFFVWRRRPSYGQLEALDQFGGVRLERGFGRLLVRESDRPRSYCLALIPARLVARLTRKRLHSDL